MTTWDHQPDYIHRDVPLIRCVIPELTWLSDLRIADLWTMFSNDLYSANWATVAKGSGFDLRHFRTWLQSNEDAAFLTRSDP